MTSRAKAGGNAANGRKNPARGRILRQGGRARSSDSNRLRERLFTNVYILQESPAKAACGREPYKKSRSMATRGTSAGGIA
jgi:hypothetical protein